MALQKDLYHRLSCLKNSAFFLNGVLFDSLIPLAARSKAWVCGRTLIGIVGSNPVRRHVGLSTVSVVCYHAEVSGMG